MQARIRATDSTLVAFGTRNTLSDTLSSTRGVGAARRWLHAQLEVASRDCGGCLRVEYDAADRRRAPPSGQPARERGERARHPARPRHVARRRRRRATTTAASAPRAPTGCLGHRRATRPARTTTAPAPPPSSRLARVVSRRWPHGLDATVVFALYAGEEQGLLGSTHLADRLTREGKTVVAAFTNDIVGNVVAEDGTTDSTSVRVYAADPDSGASRELGRYVWAHRRAAPPRLRGASDLAARPDRSRRRPLAIRPRGLARTSLHGAARELQAPASPHRRLRARELRLCRPGGAAQRGDRRLARVGSPAAGFRVRAPRVVRVGRPGVDDHLARRERCVGLRAAACAAPPRRRGSASFLSAAPRSYTLDFQLDDGWVAVRSVGPSGHRSLARAAAPAPRPAARPAR